MRKSSTIGLFFQIAVCSIGVPVCLASSLAAPQKFEPNTTLWAFANPPFRRSETPSQHKVLVGILDSGFDYRHPLLSKNIHPFEIEGPSGRETAIGWDALGQDYFPFYTLVDPNTSANQQQKFEEMVHGTHVASLVTLNDGDIGIIPVRVLPFVSSIESADPVEVEQNEARTAVRSILEGLEFSVRQGASIVNMSIALKVRDASPAPREFLLKAINTGFEPLMRTKLKDILIVAGAANDRADLDEPNSIFPATLRSENVLTVGALTADGEQIAQYSNYGRFVDVYTRGSDIKAAGPENTLASMSGTSMASALVAHLAARLKVVDPSLTGEQLRGLILNTAQEKELHIEPADGKKWISKFLPTQRLRVRVVDAKKALELAYLLVKNPQAVQQRARLLKPPFIRGGASGAGLADPAVTEFAQAPH